MNNDNPPNHLSARFLPHHTRAVPCAHPDMFEQYVDPYELHEDLPDWVNWKWDSIRNWELIRKFRRTASSFEVGVIDLFFLCDGRNRRRLVAAWPWLWMNRTECVKIAKPFWEGDESAVCETCEGRGWVPEGHPADPDTDDRACPDCWTNPNGECDWDIQ